MTKKIEPIWAVGTRKTSVARVRFIPGSGKMTVNNKLMDDFFAGHHRQKAGLLKSLEVVGNPKNYDIIAHISGGGITGQAGALRLGIARVLAKIDEKSRKILRKEGFLTRDSRMVERKKPGQPKARKKFQFSKR